MPSQPSNALFKVAGLSAHTTGIDDGKVLSVLVDQLISKVYWLMSTRWPMPGASKGVVHCDSSGWNKLRCASRVLESADAGKGNIEQAGPRLRDMTALLANDKSMQVNRSSKDLSDLPSTLATLKPNTNLLIGSEVFPPPEKEQVDANPPLGSDEGLPNAQGSDPKKQAAATQGPPRLSAAAVSVSPPVTPQPKSSDTPPNPHVAPPKAPDPAASVASVETAREQHYLRSLYPKLNTVTDELDLLLGPVISFVHRVAIARKHIDLPPTCGSSAVTLVPWTRDPVLLPGEVFQFVLQGDNGKAGADFWASLLHMTCWTRRCR